MGGFLLLALECRGARAWQLTLPEWGPVKARQALGRGKARPEAL